MEGIKVSFDLGESRIRAIVGRQGDSSLRVVASAEVESSGIEGGAISDNIALSSAISKCVRIAESQMGFPISEATVIVPAILTQHTNGQGVRRIAGRTRGIRANDLTKALSNVVYEEPSHASTEHLDLEKTLYALDGKYFIDPPIGIPGRELSVFVSLISINTDVKVELTQIFDSLGIAKIRLVPNQRAGTLGALTEGERKLGAILFDIGSRVSTLTLVKGGRMLDTGIVPGGGYHLTNDLSLGLEVSKELAEKIKLEFGTTVLEVGSAEINLERDEEEPLAINRVRMIELLKERSKEIVSLAENYMNTSGYGDFPAGGIVLTGGSSELPGLVEIVKQKFNCPVRIANPRGAERILDNLNNPCWVPVVGGLLWSNNKVGQKAPILVTKLIRNMETLKKYFSANKSDTPTTLVNPNNKTQGEVALTK
ncbi:MAG: cell division protein FtsA [Dehalococcoidia bacterium]